MHKHSIRSKRQRRMGVKPIRDRTERPPSRFEDVWRNFHGHGFLASRTWLVARAREYLPSPDMRLKPVRGRSPDDLESRKMRSPLPQNRGPASSSGSLLFALVGVVSGLL